MTALQSALLLNVHESLLPLPNVVRSSFIKSSYYYYHYCCDGVNDVGWGCGYRSLQTICSWIIRTKQMISDPPDIGRIQHLLVDMNDKPIEFIGSHDWIGCVETSYVLGALYDVQCKILHVPNGSELPKYASKFYDHFETYGSPVMIGGEDDNSAKSVMGIATSNGQDFLLIVDPHFRGRATIPDLISCNMVRWQSLQDFFQSGFYNIVFPLCSQ